MEFSGAAFHPSTFLAKTIPRLGCRSLMKHTCIFKDSQMAKILNQILCFKSEIVCPDFFRDSSFFKFSPEIFPIRQDNKTMRSSKQVFLKKEIRVD